MNILREFGREYKAAGNEILVAAREQLRDMGIADCRLDTRRGMLLVYSGQASGDRLLFEISASVRTGRIVIRFRGGETRAGGQCPVCRLWWRKGWERELPGAIMRLMGYTGVLK